MTKAASIGLLALVAQLAGAAPAAAQVLEGEAEAIGVEAPGTRGGWRQQVVALSGRPVAVERPDDSDNLFRVRIRLADGLTDTLVTCGGDLCSAPAMRPEARQRPLQDAVPGTEPARGRRNIRFAWLAAPTSRTLGTAVAHSAAGALIARDATSAPWRLDLGLDEVFDDRAVRLADLDGDGADELIVLLRQIGRGLQLVVVALDQTGLVIAARGPALEPATAWAVPLGAADFDGDGVSEIALVEDRAGVETLALWRYRGRQLERAIAIGGLATRSAIAEPGRIPLAAEITTGIVVLKRKGDVRPMLVVGLADNTVVVIR